MLFVHVVSGKYILRIFIPELYGLFWIAFHIALFGLIQVDDEVNFAIDSEN